MRALLAVVVALAAAPAASAFTPAHGHYSGSSDRGSIVTFRYTGHEIFDVRVGSVWAISQAYVSQSTWGFHDAEGHHTLRGQWTDADHVTGTYGYYRETPRG